MQAYWAKIGAKFPAYPEYNVAGMSGVVLIDEAEAEIEKARREEREKFATWNRDHEEASRSDERESILRELEEDLKSTLIHSQYRTGLSYAVECIRSRSEVNWRRQSDSNKKDFHVSETFPLDLSGFAKKFNAIVDILIAKKVL